MSISDLELSFGFELRYSKAVFCNIEFKGSSFEFVKFYRNYHVTMFPWKPRVILAIFVEFDVIPTNALLWQTNVRYKNSLCLKFLENQF